MSDLTLFPPETTITVHCFMISKCKHVVRDGDPRQAHDKMERHYAEKHAADIEALATTGELLRPTRRRRR